MARSGQHEPTAAIGAVDANAACTEADSPRLKRRHLNVLQPGGRAPKSADKTEIGWTHAEGYVGRTLNNVTGCKKISPGCKNCYAETFAERFRGTPMKGGKPHHFAAGFDVTLRPERINEPLRWRAPSMVFVNSMSDQHGEFVPDAYNDRVYDVFRRTPQHIYQVLTKRADRLVEFTMRNPWLAEAKHIWLGVSVEDREYGLPRIDLLRKANAAVRFLSIEPLLESLGTIDLTSIAWVIVGGESGRKARRMHPDWVREVRDQCVAANVPFFFKQWGEYDDHGVRKFKKHAGRVLDGRTWDEFPCGLVAASSRASSSGSADLATSDAAATPCDASAIRDAKP
jgi:protein gp37